MEVTGVGKNSIQGYLPRDAVVPVPEVTPVRVRGNHRVRPVFPYQADEVFSEFGGIFQPLVRIAQEGDFTYPKQVAGVCLFLFPGFCQVFRFYCRVAGAFITAGAKGIGNYFSGARLFG